MSRSQPVVKPLRLCVIIGGSGRTLVNLDERIKAGRLPAEIALVAAPRASLQGVARARERGLNVLITERDAELCDACAARDVDLICLAGYLRKFCPDARYRDCIINIHPALLPRFGGKGMFGMHVHRAVLASGATESGCTVHWVDDEYDHGRIILQRRCAVQPDDTPESLAARVFELECDAYPDAIGQLAAAGTPQSRKNA
ncbi:MAG: phosphoribosylglycinamide formyltransferase [Phycisphaerales bacterium]